MKEYFKLNGKEMQFGSFSTEGTIYSSPNALTTEVLVRSGRMRINILSEAFELTKEFYYGSFQSDYYLKDCFLEQGIRLVTYQDLEIPHGKYGTTIQCPYNDFGGFEVYGFPGRGRFFGKILIEEGYVQIDGEIRFQEDDPVIPISIRKNFEAKKLRAKNSAFTFQQALEKNPEVVYQINFEQGVFTSFPEELLNFPNLMEIKVNSSAVWSFENLPDQFYQLTTLCAFSCCGPSSWEINEPIKKWKSIDARIVQLVNLEELRINQQELSNLPAEIGKLTQLRLLELEQNQLTSLPESIGELPHLKSLSISENKFTSLPKNLKNIPDVKIERHFRKLYKDMSYASKNTNPIDKSLFNLDNHTNEKQQLEQILTQEQIEEPFKQVVLDYATLATYFITKQLKYDDKKHDYNFERVVPIKLGASKLGGAPHLPKGMEHPKNKKGELYLFMAQLNCEELAPYQNYLPRTGILYFFVNDIEYAQNPKVLFHPNTTELEIYSYSEEANFIDPDFIGTPYPEVEIVKIKNHISLPNFYNAWSYGIERFPKYKEHFEPSKFDDDAYYEAFENFEDVMINRVNNAIKKEQYEYNTMVSDDFHSINNHVFTQHESPQEQAATAFGGEADEWMVLLNVESIPPFSFWDAGTLTFCIHKKDLAIGDFSKIYSSIESS